jgi:hypothetical protein
VMADSYLRGKFRPLNCGFSSTCCSKPRGAALKYGLSVVSALSYSCWLFSVVS